MTVTIDHVSLNVADLERSTKFYCEGLGFEVVDERAFTNIVDAADGVFVHNEGPKIRFRCRTLKGHGITLVFNDPEISPVTYGPAGGHFGFSNWAFSVEDLDETVQKLCAAGSTVKKGSKSSLSVENETLYVVVLDPDGEYVELIETRPAS